MDVYEEENLTNDDMESRIPADLTDELEEFQTAGQDEMGLSRVGDEPGTDVSAVRQSLREQLDGIGQNETDDADILSMKKLYEMLKTKLDESSANTDVTARRQELQDIYLEISAVAQNYTKAVSINDRSLRRYARSMMNLVQLELNKLETMDAEQADPLAVSQPQPADHAASIRDWGTWLKSMEKGGLGRENSEYFNRVQEAIEKTAQTMDKGFDESEQKNFEKLNQALSACKELKDACERYTARKPRTRKGKNRREVVLQIQGFAAKDALSCEAAIADFLQMSPQEQAQETWTSVIRKGRSASITVDDFSKFNHPEKGQASEVFIITSGEGKQATTRYFKKEDSLDVSGGVGKNKNALYYITLDLALKKYPKLSEDDKEILREEAKDPGRVKGELSTEGKMAMRYIRQERDRLKISVQELLVTLGIVDEGGMANMSRRNVASSRMAELLGLGGLLAKSQTVEIFDKASGQTIRGNLMDKAKGVEREKVQEKLKNKKVTSGFMRDVMNLQVLDMICGQVDRHGTNLMYELNENQEISGIQGIDNDASFGTRTDAVSGRIDQARSDARVFDERTGEMRIPYMDKKLADRIETIESSMIRYILSDLLRKDEVDAAVTRFEIIKNNLEKAQKEHPERFLENEEDWKMETVGEQLIAEYQTKLKKSTNAEGAVIEYLQDDPYGDVEEYQNYFSDTAAAYRMYVGPQFDEFKRTYKEEGVKKMFTLYKKAGSYLYDKYGAEKNYFGRLMYV